MLKSMKYMLVADCSETSQRQALSILLKVKCTRMRIHEKNTLA